MMRKTQIIIAAAAVLLVGARWQVEKDFESGGAATLITIVKEANHYYDENVLVEYHPSGAIYVAFNDNNTGTGKRSIKLYKFDDGKVSFVKDVSESNLVAYEPDMVIDKGGDIHLAWAEGVTGLADTQYIKYRVFNGSSWSSITTLRTLSIPGSVGGHNTEKIDDMRLAVDDDRNLFIAITVWPAARCQTFSRYGSTVYTDTFPVTARNKHASVAADDNYAHLTWVGLSGSEYYIQYARRSNSPGSAWGGVQLVQGSAGGVVDRPFIQVSSQKVPQLVYMKTTAEGGRHVWHRSKPGSSFSDAYQVSKSPMAYHPPKISVFNNSNQLVVAQTWAGGARNYYKWMRNGTWGDFTYLGQGTASVAQIDGALSADGEAAVAYTTGTSIVLALLDYSGPIDPDDPVPNEPPSAFFSFSPTSGLYPLKVTCNASNSKDSDGEIVSYKWNFGDGASGTGKIASHTYNSENVFQIKLTVTDDDGASSSAAGLVDVFGLAPPLNVQYNRHENRNLFSVEYLYRITWNANPRNVEIGAKIVAYKIYRREVGKGALGHFYTLQVNNQDNYEYLDRTLGSTPRVFEYQISAVDSAGRESSLQ